MPPRRALSTSLALILVVASLLWAAAPAAIADTRIVTAWPVIEVEPGLFARNCGPMTPMGLLVGHAIYGRVVALVYGALV